MTTGAEAPEPRIRFRANIESDDGIRATTVGGGGVKLEIYEAKR